MLTKKSLLLFFLLQMSLNSHAQINWQPTNGPYGGYVLDMQKDFKGSYYAATQNGLFTSTDNCEHWTYVHISQYVNEGMGEIFIHPSGRLFISGWGQNLYISDPIISNWQAVPFKRQINIDSHGTLFGINGGTIYSSTDIGQTWEVFKSFNRYIKYFCMVKDSNFVIATDSVYYSSDMGKSWHSSKILFNWDSGFIVDSNNNIYFIVNWDLYKSSDGGKSWEIIYDHTIHFPPRDPFREIYRVLVDQNGVIYVCTETNLFSSSDGGKSWQNVGNVPYPVLKFWHDDLNNIFCIGGNDGIEKYDQVNKVLYKKSIGITAFSFNQILHWGNSLIFSDGGSAHYVTTDQGNSWKEISLPTPMFGNIIFINSKNRIFIECEWRVLYSDDGVQWKPIYFSNAGRIYDIAFAEFNNILFLFDADHILWRSTDYGVSWFKIWSGNYYSPNKSISAISANEIYFSYDNIIYKTTDLGNMYSIFLNMDAPILTFSMSPWGNIFIGTKSGLYQYDIDGLKRINLTANSGPIKKIVYSGTSQMFVLGSSIYVSGNFGKDFSLLDANNNITNSFGYLDFDVSNNTLFLTQPYPNILKSTYYFVDNSSLVQTQLLYNYPNPFRSNTTFAVYVSEPCNLSISIFDLLGRKVESISQTYSSVGFYNILWQPKHLASGIYFYQLQTPFDKQAKKMIYLK
ncbi:MAG: T9SS type A sorting domain-containing protein [Ignavibacteriales bacterium]|nr:T9SS type A sorting domain-containing protein [Ignavibacteriales bacterium]